MTGPSRRSVLTAAGLGVGAALGVQVVATPAPAGARPARPATPAGAAPAGVPSVAAWGGCVAVHSACTDTLTLELANTGSAPAALDRFDLFGQPARVTRRGYLAGPDGRPVGHFRCHGGLRLDAPSETLVLAGGRSGTITVTGIRLDPPAGTAFPVVTAYAGTTSVLASTAAVGFHRPDHQAESAQAPQTLAALRRLSDYLDTVRTDTGWLIATAFGGAAEECQGIAGIASGYMTLERITGEPGFRTRARRALDWLVDNQNPGGSYPFPWDWGMSNGHAYVPAHYANGSYHPAGTVYAVTTINAARALVDGFGQYRDHRYLDAAVRVRDYLLGGSAEALKWLDRARTRASIPYCTFTPMVPDDDPLLQDRHVLPYAANTSVETYNIDAFAVRFFAQLHRITDDRELLRHGDALARNMMFRINPNGSINYAWYQPDQPDYYTYAVCVGLIQYGQYRRRSDWVEAGRNGLTWRDNAYHPSLILSEAEAVRPLRLDNTDTVISYLTSTLAAQHPDGSWTSGTNTRGDADKLGSLSGLLEQMGYHS